MKGKLFCIWMCIAMIVTLMPSMAFADETSASDTIDATIAIVEGDENGRESYNTGTIIMDVEPGSLAESCVIGIGTDTDFCPMSGSPDSYTISVKKDEWAEAVTKKNPNEEEPLCEGAFLGWYNNEEEVFYLGYNQEAILPSADAYGNYQITITWTQDEKTYVALTTLTLQGAAKLLRGEFYEQTESYETEKGFLCSWITLGEMKKNETEQFMLNYAPYYDYQGNPEKYTMLYSDEKHGIFSFTESDCDVEGLFSKGDAVSYKNDLEISPLLLDYSKVTADMIGKNYTLSFMSDTGEIATCSVAVTLRNELDYLEDGQVYIIENGRVKEDGRLYIANWEERVQDLVKSEFADQIKREMEITTYHFGIWNKTDGNFIPVGILCDDTAVTISGNKEQGYKLYAGQETKGTFITTDGKSIFYTFTLPEAGFYRTPVRSAESYLAEAVYLAEETLQDNHYTFYYIAQADEAFPKNDLQVGYKLSNSISVTSINDWADNETGTSYYVWQINVDEQFNTDEGFWIEVSGQKNEQFYYRRDWLTIHDTDVVPKNQRLYWFNASEVQVDADGTIQLRDEAGGSVDEYASFEENWTNRTGNIKSYFAVKRDEKYFAVDNVQLTYTEGMSMSASTEEPYLYTLTWTNFGTYSFTVNEGGEDYHFTFNVTLPDAGFYSTGLRSESSYIEEEFHFINASEKSQDGTEANFYLIATSNEYAENQIKMEYGEFQWNQTLGQGVWTKKSLPTGISIGTPNMEKFDDETYIIWRITVTNAYKNENLSHQFKVSYNGEEGMYYGESIKIYDSSEIPRSEKLYWFGSNQVQATSNGILFSEDGDINDFASREWVDDSKSAATEGYFAILLEDGAYQAIPSHEVIVPQTMRIYRAENAYMSLVEWGGYGEYTITAIYNQQKYRTVWKIKLAEYGFFLSKEVCEADSIGCKFSFNYAKEKSEDGQEAYFYLIGDLRNEKYQASDIKIIIGELNNMHELQNGELEGVSFGEIRTMQYEGKTYFTCKVSVSKTFDFSGEIWVGMSYGQGEVENLWYGNLYIYGGNYFFGDADGNKKVDYSDVLYMKRYLAEWKNYKNISESADTNGTDDVEMDDLIILERHIAGWTGYAMLPYVDNLF